MYKYIYLCKNNPLFVLCFGLLDSHSHTLEGENPKFLRVVWTRLRDLYKDIIALKYFGPVTPVFKVTRPSQKLFQLQMSVLYHANFYK